MLTRNIKEKEKLGRLRSGTVDQYPEFTALMNELMDELEQAALRYRSSPKLLGAELNSLDRIGVNKGDQLYFLTTHTLDGMLVGEALKKIVTRFWEVDAYYETVEGLQVQNADAFCYLGLPQLVNKVTAILEKHPADQYRRIFNTTGGFKAVSFYMTILGMLEGVTVKYLFENSDHIIEMPAAPVYFNIESFYRLGRVIEKMLNGAIHESELIWLTGRSRQQLKGEFSDILVWQPDGTVTLSALARIIYIRLVWNNPGKFIINFPKK